ncbi:MAG: RNA polymerase sigma factor [Clostridia bacterium]|nr:RNA polymerase sigma factor [Clostridia bacterium]
MDKKQAAGFLHERMKPVYGYCLRRCATAQDAEDLAQEILLRAFDALLHRKAADPERYLWTIARNALANHYRERTRSTIGVPAEAVDGSDLQAELLARDELRRLYQELSRLSRQQREIVVMHYFHGMKSAEVAAALNLPTGTVKWHLFEARKELKHQMTHPRETSHLKFDPIHFSAFGIEGSIGPDGSPWRVFRSRLHQNIAYACWRTELTAPQIAEALGVSPVYIEDEIDRMAEQGYLVARNGSYRCAILLTEWTEDLIRLSDNMYTGAAALIAPALADALSPAILADEGIILPQDCRRDYALWALIPWMISSMPGGPISFREAATLRPDGSHNLCHAAITPPGIPQPALAGPMERFSGPCWNEHDGMTLWQIDTIWSEDRIREMFQVTEARILSLLQRLLSGGTLDKSDVSLLIQRGILHSSCTADGLQKASLLPVWLRGGEIRQKLSQLAQSVFDMHRDALEALRAPWAAALLADTPPHLLRLREYLLQGTFRDGRFIVHCMNHLVANRILAMPSVQERGSLHTVLLTD